VAILWAIGVVVVVAFLVDAANRRGTRDLRQSGFLPPPGQGTNADVERLVALGRKIDAIKLYREIQRTDLKTAKEAIDRMAQRPDLGGRRGSS